MDWKLTSEELPEGDIKGYGQVPCLVSKRYDFTNRKGEDKSYHQTQILIFNIDHQCWDQEDGDDYDCDIE
jgi:hypothetical protein